MNTKVLAAAAATFILMLAAPEADAQRRQRPGSMKHTQTEMENAQKTTKVSVRYIKDSSEWRGPIYLTNGAGSGIELGKAVLWLEDGTYTFSVEFGSDKIREVDQKFPGVTTRVKGSEIGQNFSKKGRYETLRQYGKTFLRLWDGNNVFADISVTDETGENMEFSADEYLFKLTMSVCGEWLQREADMRMQRARERNMKHNAKKR